MLMNLAPTVPSGFSLLRLLIGLAFPLIPSEWRLWAVVVAAITDAIDGLIARWLHAESSVGQMLDPIADKVFVLMLGGTLFVEGAIHPLWVLGIILRDIAVLAGVGVTAWRGHWERYLAMKPSWLGKCTTAAQFALLIVLVAWGDAPVWLLTAITLLSAAAAVDYVRRYQRIVNA
jgi:CDP-diacylglycerol--glycerol-3-phosphate 3-phosphatidyltransferase/cardiolipin synthase